MEFESKTDFKGCFSDPEGYILNLGTRTRDKFFRTMEDLELYLGETYIDICQPYMMNKTLDTFPDPDMPSIIPYMGADYPKTETEVTYPKKNNIDEAIHQKLSKKDVYKTDMNKIYNIILGQTNDKLQKKVASDSTFQAVKTGLYPIGYLTILNNICFSNQYEQHTICSICLKMSQLYSIM